jgi:hypothetical protein
MPSIDTERADVIVDETIESGERVIDLASADDEQATCDSVADEDGDAALTPYLADQEPIEGGITLVDLTLLSCRWPTGNPRDLTTFRYCGEAAPCGPYCERHARLAYLSRSGLQRGHASGGDGIPRVVAGLVTAATPARSWVGANYQCAVG